MSSSLHATCPSRPLCTPHAATSSRLVALARLRRAGLVPLAPRSHAHPFIPLDWLPGTLPPHLPQAALSTPRGRTFGWRTCSRWTPPSPCAVSAARCSTSWSGRCELLRSPTRGSQPSSIPRRTLAFPDPLNLVPKRISRVELHFFPALPHPTVSTLLAGGQPRLD